MNDDDFFEDDRSFTSHQTSETTFDSHPDSYHQLHSFPSQQNHDFRSFSAPGPLLTLRGNNFLNRMSPQNIVREKQDVLDNTKLRGNQQKHSSKDSDFYVRQEKLLTADVDAVKEYSENENWKVERFNSNLDYDDNDVESRVPYLPIDLGKNVRYDDASNGQSQTDSYEHERSFDSFHNHFGGIDRKDSPFGTIRTGPYDDDYSGKKLNLSHGEEYPDGCLSNFPDLKQVQALIDGGHEEIGIANFDNNNNDKFDSYDIKQLRVLYEARGRKIEELQISLENSKEKHATEIRVLQHKLALITGMCVCW